jgi:hypothetical protein
VYTHPPLLVLAEPLAPSSWAMFLRGTGYTPWDIFTIVVI